MKVSTGVFGTLMDPTAMVQAVKQLRRLGFQPSSLAILVPGDENGLVHNGGPGGLSLARVHLPGAGICFASALLATAFASAAESNSNADPAESRPGIEKRGVNEKDASEKMDVIDRLVKCGMSEEAARRYKAATSNGAILLGVICENKIRSDSASKVLRDMGADDIDTSLGNLALSAAANGGSFIAASGVSVIASAGNGAATITEPAVAGITAGGGYDTRDE